MRIVIVHDQVIGLFDSVLFVRLYVLPVSRESESRRYRRAEYERDRVSLVPAVGKSTCAIKRRRFPSTL